MWRALLLAFAAILLSGCCAAEIEKIARLERQLLAAENAIANERGKREAEIAESERRAAIAQACEYLINVCPHEMVAPGLAEIAAGATGGGIYFWVLVIVKFLAIGSMSGGLLMGAAAVWASATRPALEKKAAAEKIIAEAQQNAEALRAQARAQAAGAAQAALQAKKQLAQMQQARDAAAQALYAAEQALEQLRAEHERLSAEVAQLQDAKRLLSGL